MLPTLIPSTIPAASTAVAPPPTPSVDAFSLYDIAIGGLSFVFSNTPNDPLIRETVPPEKTRIDQAATPGEQTLSNWWIKSQDSFHGGAGQKQLEPAFPTPYDHIRYDLSRNVDVFTPGQVSRLPDTTVLSSDNPLKVLGIVVAGVDAIAYLTGTTVKIITTPATSPTIVSVTGITGGNVLDIATDGSSIFCATGAAVWQVNPATPASATKLATYAATATTGPVVGWVKARLMLGVNGGVFELDITTSGVTLALNSAGGLRYQHPTAGYVWRCFSTSPTAVVAAGDAFGQSGITQFAVNLVSGAPVLQVTGEIAPMPVGERILSMVSCQGAYLVVGTTKGIRVGTYNTYTGALIYGPLILPANAPTIPAVSLATRDRFIYAAGLAYDEGGLIRVDLGTQVDQAGRYAWAPDLIAPTMTMMAATSVATLPVSGSIVFGVTGTGVLLEGSTAGTGREAWIRTSRIRFNTTEPKIFKLGRVRGNITSGELVVSATTVAGTTPVITVGFSLTDPDEFKLPVGLCEWMQVTVTLLGSGTQLTSYQVKALPGSRRQRHLQFVLSLADSKTTKTGQKVRDALSSRALLAALEELDAVGDEILLQEFTPTGTVSTLVVIETLSFKQIGRPTDRSDLGGDITIVLRTVES